MAVKQTRGPVFDTAENIGRNTVRGVEEFGLAGVLVVQSFYWLVAGPRQRQPVRLSAVFAEAREIGINALLIVGVLAATIGVMLAIQGIFTLRIFGAESRVVFGLAKSMTREFAPLITGILVAGRSGSALAARIGTMKINQELDALSVMGINPVRYLVAPALIAMIIMVPALTFFSELVGLLAAGVYVNLELDIGLRAYWSQVLDSVTIDDLAHGLGKSAIFAVLIAIVGVVNGASVTGGAEGVGRATTRSVVHAISAIIITDMLFAFVVTR